MQQDIASSVSTLVERMCRLPRACRRDVISLLSLLCGQDQPDAEGTESIRAGLEEILRNEPLTVTRLVEAEKTARIDGPKPRA